MIIKRFQAKTEQEAIENAKKELGPGVVIMNVKNVKKKGLLAVFKKTMVEVTVALEEERERTPIPVKSVTTPQLQEQAKPQMEVIPPPAPATLTALEQLARAQEQNNRVLREQEENAKGNGTNALVNAGANVKPLTNADVSTLANASASTLANANASTLALEEKLENLENLLKQQIDGSDANKEEISEEDSEQIKFAKLLYNTMIDNEVHEKYANQIMEEVEKGAAPNMSFDYFLSNVYQKMILKFGKPQKIEPAAKGAKVVFFVGPTGVGKTTTIAKIASKFCVDEKKKVVLLTADTYRIAAAEQLRTYANILEVPFRIIYSAQEMEAIYHEFEEYDYILIDTAGHSHHNDELKLSNKVMIHSLDEIAEKEVYLVLSATTKYRDLVSIADTYSEMTDYTLIFTKLDETTSLGNLLNLRLHTDAEMSYVTCGQNVPEDMEFFNPQTTVKQILGGKA